MNKEDKHIDNLFKSKLEQQEFEIPDAFVDDLNKRLDEKRKNKTFAWILFSLIILLTGFSFMLLNLEGSISRSIPKGTYQMTTAEDEPYSYEDSIITNQKKSRQETKNSPVQSIDNQENNEPTITHSNKSVKKKPNNNKVITSQSEPTQKTPEKQKTIESTNKANRSENTSLSNNSRENNSRPIQAQNQDSVTTDNSLDESFLTPINEDTIRVCDSIRYIDSLVIRDSVVIKDSVRYIDSTLSQEQKDKKSKFELQLYGGFDFSQPTYSTKDLLENNEERGTGNVNTGLLFNYLHKNISAGIGIEYQSTGEKFRYSNTTLSTYDSTIITYDTVPILDTFGNVIGNQIFANVDTVNYTDTNEVITEGKNQYHWVTVPLRLGYQFKIKSWALIPRVGINFHFGVANSNANYFLPSTETLENVPTRIFTMSYHLQLEIRKNFKKFHLFLRPHFNGMFLPTHETSTYRRRYNSFGGQFGIGIQF